MKNKKERHHVIGISIGGIHEVFFGQINEGNLVELTDMEHKKVHDTLGVPYEKIRQFRMKHEICLVKGVEYYSDLHKIQIEYFAKLHLLPKRVIALHNDSICRQVEFFAELFEYKGPLLKDADFLDEITSFNLNLAIYHKIFMHRVEKYEKRLNKK